MNVSTATFEVSLVLCFLQEAQLQHKHMLGHQCTGRKHLTASDARLVPTLRQPSAEMHQNSGHLYSAQVFYRNMHSGNEVNL